MDIGSAMSVVQTLFTACSELKEICSYFGYESQLADLQRTVSTVKAVLLDAETKLELSNEAQLWIEELKDAIYNADDLFDKFVTLTEQKQRHVMEGGKASKKVRRFFSRHNPFSFAYNMSQEVKKIREEIDAIAINHTKFGFLSLDSQPMKKRREDTCSYVYEDNIIGRENDVDEIVGVLLDSNNVERNVSFLSVVGVGGLGKTALAQLVFNDARVLGAFPLRLWTCVSDHDQKQLDVEGILRKILASITGHQPDGSTKEWVQSQVREKLASNKCLLVLDDVWTENRNHWLNLVQFLLGAQMQSWVLVTTRSQETARIIGDVFSHKLQGLSNENSWRLFKKVAFGSEQSGHHDDDLVKMGQEIAKGCAGVPLALRVVGSLLYGQENSKWLSVQEIGLANVRECQDDIMPILKLSYNNLESPLQSCFSYCSLFPKDFRIEKEMLISMWLAQGYIVLSDEHQSCKEVVAKEYFSILLRRCFFQDVSKDELGEISTCKIHDLMHDIAQKVAGKEICVSDCINENMHKKVRHLVLKRSESKRNIFTKTHIRSYLQVGWRFNRPMMDQLYLEALISNFTCIRVLDLSRSNIKSLPSRIGELLHLRYLDLSGNMELEVLPTSIKKLYNLETLSLTYCEKLKELPKHISKLVKLRVLDITGCHNMNYMPAGLGMLTNLHSLPEFVLREASSNCKQWFDHLEDLKALKKLNGSLHFRIQFPKNAQIDSKREGGYLKDKEHLKCAYFTFRVTGVDGRLKDNEEALMEDMQPHCNLKILYMWRYHGVRMPSWAKSLQNLVDLKLSECRELKHLACLGNMRHLKVLRLLVLPNLEYIIENCSASHLARAVLPNAEGLSVLPSLERIDFYDLPKLKGWVADGHQLDCSSSMEMESLQLLCLSGLKSWKINNCRELKFIPSCPGLVRLSFKGFSERLRIIKMDGQRDLPSPTTIPKLRKVTTDNMTWLKSLPMESFQKVESMSIKEDKKLEGLGEVEQVLRSCSSSLRGLHISCCDNLSSVCGGLEHLTSLESLKIVGCPNLKLSEEEEKEDGDVISIPWRSFRHSLHLLYFKDLPQLMDLPNWIQHLTALDNFMIVNCKELNSLPSWMSKLTSLTDLRILKLLNISKIGQVYSNIKFMAHKDLIDHGKVGLSSRLIDVIPPLNFTSSTHM
ncbi:putative disease resistance protein RGA1 [Beta vulgaris subsp. vulgaris]|uniref:putative disease resistance protein RGA1 n=1 Tax=Beta vulgaris subsp. vulgaris TaxID=3555 RepID=UPI002547E03C|nr:putative disease resistance protein RGA1 [Beta vulgaris subsp. vulgaris]